MKFRVNESRTKWCVDEERSVYLGRLFKVTTSRLTVLPTPKAFGGRRTGGRCLLRETVIHPGAAAILPILSRDKIILVRQLRYAARRELWEIPAGTLDKGEKPLHCARRELEEETGYKAKIFKKLVSFYPCPGYSSEIIHLYQATRLIKTLAHPETDEDIKIKIFTRSEIRKSLAQRKFIDAKTIIGLMIWIKKQTHY
jgi:ADP-ribose pyrophosphatase